MTTTTRPVELVYPGNAPTYARLLDMISVFERHGCLVCPSDTCYGVFAPATDPKAVELVKDLTGRRDDALPVTVGSVREAVKLIELRERHARFIGIAWPGAFLAISRARRRARHVVHCVNAGRMTLGVRVTSDNVEAALSRELDVPIVSTAVRYPNGQPVRNGDDAMMIISAVMSMRGTPEARVAISRRDSFRYPTHSTVGEMVNTDQLVEVLREGVYSHDAVRRLVRYVSGRHLSPNVIAPFESTDQGLSWSDPTTWEDVT